MALGGSCVDQVPLVAGLAWVSPGGPLIDKTSLVSGFAWVSPGGCWPFHLCETSLDVGLAWASLGGPLICQAFTVWVSQAGWIGIS